MADTRRKNGNWTLPTQGFDWQHVQVAVLMDIRDELQQINRSLGCYRIPRALDALIEQGVDLRRKKRAAATKRKNAKTGGAK